MDAGDEKLLVLAQSIHDRIDQARLDTKFVLCESCTGGRAAAALVAVPGISQYFCGSHVVYRSASKIQWLEIPSDLIREHSAESAEVTLALAKAALERTPEASISAAITGHLSAEKSRRTPQPHVFMAVAHRHSDLASHTAASAELLKSTRIDRQTEAASHLLSLLLAAIENEQLDRK